MRARLKPSTKPRTYNLRHRTSTRLVSIYSSIPSRHPRRSRAAADVTRRRDLETSTTRVSHHHPPRALDAPTRHRRARHRATRARASHIAPPIARARSRLHRAVARAPAAPNLPTPCARENPKNHCSRARSRVSIRALNASRARDSRRRAREFGSTRARSTYLVGSPFAIVVVASRKGGARDAGACGDAIRRSTVLTL